MGHMGILLSCAQSHVLSTFGGLYPKQVIANKNRHGKSHSLH